MYLYNIKHQLRTIKREEINDILYVLDNEFKEVVENMGFGDLIIKPFVDGRAIVVYERQKWFDRSFDNPDKDIISGIILYYTLIGKDFCTYSAFTCNAEDFDIENGYFGQVKINGITEDSHFKRINQFTLKMRELYPAMLEDGSDIFYKNNYLILNSYPAGKQARYELSQILKEKYPDAKYLKNEPWVTFTYNGEKCVVIVRNSCLLCKGIIYSSSEDLMECLESKMPLRIEDILLDIPQNKNFIDFVLNNESLEELIQSEQLKEMDEAQEGNFIF